MERNGLSAKRVFPESGCEFSDTRGGMLADALHGVDPYTYLVDVLQRISEHPASRVAELAPRLWKQYFAANPLRSDIHDFPV
jgi:transposase